MHSKMLLIINVNHSVLNILCKYVGNNDTNIKYNILVVLVIFLPLNIGIIKIVVR